MLTDTYRRSYVNVRTDVRKTVHNQKSQAISVATKICNVNPATCPATVGKKIKRFCQESGELGGATFW